MHHMFMDGPKNPLKVQDNTLRDGHQSLLATRMRIEDMLPIAERMDEMGFWAMEVWGGATFDTMHRFLAEDPIDLHGKTPTPIDPEVQKLVLKNYKRGQTPITGRAADYLEPELEEARKKIGDLAKDDFDLLIYALYPTTGEQFLKWKYGLEEKPRQVFS